MKKNLFVIPVTDVLEVAFKNLICQSDPNRVRSNSASSGYGISDDYDLGDI